MITLTKATPKAIRYACLKFHYAKAVPSVQYGYNVYENGEWCGVICFGGGANNNAGKPFGLVPGEWLELVRVALNGKQKTTSQCVAKAVKRLHLDAPRVKMLLSYADIDQEHFGTIYQALNWIYLGETDANDTYFIINGKKTHRRTIGAMGGIESIGWVKANLDKNAIEFKTNGKRKYVFAFDKRLRKQYQKKAVPYPKKEGAMNGE